jgi:hypothetical protein
MMAQVIHALIIFVVSYVVTGVVLIEITMWLMTRLDRRAAYRQRVNVGPSSIRLRRHFYFRQTLGAPARPKAA